MVIEAPERAFLPPQDPLKKLDAIPLLDDLACELPSLLAAQRARGVLSRIPTVNVDLLQSNAERERALAILSVLGHAAVHESWRDVSSDSVPASIAVPWVKLATEMGRYPVLTYASHGLNNWRRLEPSGPVELGNIAVLFNFFGGLDENWFVTTHVDIEATAAPLVASVVNIRNAQINDDPDVVSDELVCVAKTLALMAATLQRVRENCDPDIFFNRVQPFMQGMRGVRYEGVIELNGKPQNFPGGSGAQSTILPLLDGLLGVLHAEDALIAYLTDLRRYMPPAHQAFLTAIESGQPLRPFLKKHATSILIERYNQCINELGNFRAQHLEMSIDYIQRPARKLSSSRGEVGTGGSPFVGYLKKHREETFSHLLTEAAFQVS